MNNFLGNFSNNYNSHENHNNDHGDYTENHDDNNSGYTDDYNDNHSEYTENNENHEDHNSDVEDNELLQSLNEEDTEYSSSDDQNSEDSSDSSEEEEEYVYVVDEFLNIPNTTKKTKEEKYSEVDIFKIYNLTLLLNKLPEGYSSGFSVIHPEFRTNGSIVKQAMNLSSTTPGDISTFKENLGFIKEIIGVISNKESKDPMSDILNTVKKINGLTDAKRERFIEMIRKIDMFESEDKKQSNGARKATAKNASELDIIDGLKTLIEETNFSEKISKVYDLSDVYLEAIS